MHISALIAMKTGAIRIYTWRFKNGFLQRNNLDRGVTSRSIKTLIYSYFWGGHTAPLYISSAEGKIGVLFVRIKTEREAF